MGRSSSSSSDSSSSSSSSSSASSGGDGGRRGREAAEREAARAAVLTRKRQWNTVGSDDESDDGKDGARDRKRAKKEKKKAKKKEKKEKKKAKKKDKKKDKKKKKSKKKDKKPTLGACDQDRFGKYGIVRESDYFRKTQEFEAWCAEVKGIPAFTGTKRDLMELFLEYAEDYNTATMPHQKYYDFEKWELAEYERKKRGETSKKRGKVRAVFDDEAAVAAERRAANDARDAAADERDLRAAAARLGGDAVEGLRRQEQLRQEQQLAHKRGDLATVRRIDRELRPIEAPKQSGPPPAFS